MQGFSAVKARRRVLLSLAAVALVAAAAAAWRSPSAVDLPTATVERGAFIDEMVARGEIRPSRSQVLTAPSSAGEMQIIQIVANGASVRAGDPVVVFDPTAHQRTREQKGSELKQARAELEKARAEARRRVEAAAAELEKARSIGARQRLDLAGAELASRVEAGKREIAVANAERFVAEIEEKLAADREAGAASVAIAEQKVAKVQYDVDDTRRILEALTLRAPADGMVTLLPNFRAGGPMSRSAPEFRRGDRAWPGAAIAELPDLSAVRVTLRVDEADRARLRAGAPVRVRVDAVPDRELDGTVAEISLVATPDFSSFPPVRNFDVTVTLAASDPRLRSGMSAGARLEVDRLDGVLLVPAAAVFERDGASVAYVVAGRAVTARHVVVARRGREQAAIAEGLEAGMRVALSAPNAEEDP
jgi:HlyD family secretion protein